MAPTRIGVKCFATLAGLFLLACAKGNEPGSATEPQAVANGRKVNMVTVQPDSRSVILRSTHILLIRILTSEAGPWSNDANGNLVRQTRMTVRLEQILKGELDQPAGSPVRIEVRQFGRPGTRVYAVPGVWSDQPTAQGTQLVTFASSPSRNATSVLVEPDCKTVVPAESALADVRVALDAERDGLSLGDSLRLAEPSAPSLQNLFGEYLTAKYAGTLLGNAAEFSALLRFVENPDLSPVARTTLLDFATSEIGEARAPSPQALRALVNTLFHLVAMPEAQALHDNVIGVYLPAVLRWNGSHYSVGTAEVFPAPADRARAEATLNNYHGAASTEALKAWLRK